MRNADLLMSAGDTALAKNIYKSVLTSGEKTPQALFGLGLCLESEGKLPEAKRHYEESIAYQPALESYRRLGLLLVRMNKDQEAAEVLARALNLKDLSPEARYELHKASGNAFTRSKRVPEAEKHFLKALELKPGADEIRTSLGALCLQQGKTSEARRHFQDAFASNPRSASALMGLGSCFLADGEKRQAHDCFAKSLEIDLNNATAVFHLVKCAYEIKSYATAARVLEEYVQVAPVNSNLLYSLAGLQFHLGRLNDAKATAKKILELQPSHAGASELVDAIERNQAEARI
jgi:tetratricopeptide (TPR) repeat protein